MAIYKLPVREFNAKLAEELKQFPELKAPEWSYFVKSSVARQRPIQEPDFWYKRTASILRQIYINGAAGVSRLRTRYGSRKKRGSKPEEFRKASGKISLPSPRRILVFRSGRSQKPFYS